MIEREVAFDQLMPLHIHGYGCGYEIDLIESLTLDQNRIEIYLLLKIYN